MTAGSRRAPGQTASASAIDAPWFASAWPLVVGFAILAIPTLMRLADQTWSKDSAAQGPLVLASGAWLLWRQLPEMRAAARPFPLWPTLALLAASLAAYVFGRAYDFITLEAAGLYGVGVSMLLSRFGLAAVAGVWFPLAYLAATVPAPAFLVDSATAPLKHFVTWAATSGLAATGLPVAREGVTIFVGQYQLLVEDACSGMNSLVGLCAISLLYIYLIRRTSLRYALLLAACVVPIAIAANIVRIVILILLTWFFGDAVAQSFLHYAAGLFLFTVSLLLVFALDSVLWKLFGRRFERPPPQSPRRPMTGRRDFLIGAACVGGAAAALALEPRRRVSLLGGRRLSQIVPAAFAGWNSRDVSDLVAPAPEGSLQARLYGQTVERLYQNGADGAEVMVLIAYGDSQTNDLQLHRPEVCYPAFGFEIVGSRDLSLPLAGGVNLPSRALAAAAPNRRETIVYWTRLGAYLPTSVAQQRVDRLRTSMSGVIADGVLARCSCLNPDFASAIASLEAFVAGMVLATPPAERAVLIGEARARALAARGA